MIVRSIKEATKKTLKKVPYLYPHLHRLRLVQIGKKLKVEHKKIMANSIHGKNTAPLFTAVEIETINRCNGSCSFCPVNRHLDKREFKKMTDQLFNKIIDELYELEYDGTLSLFSNNEPFLDKRLEGFAEIARHRLPHARMVLYTNGTLLSLERFRTVITFLDELIIDNYNNHLRLNEPVKAIHEYCKQNSELNKKVKIFIRKDNEILSSRGGQAPNKANTQTIPLICLQPFRQFIVRPDGRISLCCNDPLGKYTLGDISTQTMQEVWHSQRYLEIRDILSSDNGREKLELCRNCDVWYV
ncbi:MAG TPA: radical SAM protein [Ruminococcaceae bacterium]|nr:radical SAM protein [Oscillospiraceae bacterium]